MMNKPKEIKVKNSILREIIKEIQKEKRCTFPYWGNWNNWNNWNNWENWSNWRNWRNWWN